MAISQRLDLRQAQSLVMTPQLQQAIKLLELSNQDLAAFVAEEMERNPLLERADESGAGADDATPQDAADGLDQGSGSDGAGAQAPDSLLDAKEYSDREVMPDQAQSPLDTDYDNHYAERDPGFAVGQDPSQSGWKSTAGGRSGFDNGEDDLESSLSRAPTLREHLETQMGIEIADPTERLIALQIIDMVDDSGYVSVEIEGLAGRLGCAEDLVGSVLAKLQRLDPIGVCARNLAECLALQLRELDRLDPAMQALLEHLELLARHDQAQLMRVCGVDADDLADMAAEIRALNPRPGYAFDKAEVQAIQPDILVQRRADGSWSVELNPETLPRVLVNHSYVAQIGGKTQRKKSDADYLAERLSAANWLVKTLHQRSITILKVASEIVRQQEAFFVHGVKHLRPLTRRDVAEAIEMHESTVSRVAANKFMATPRGVFELRYFFSAAIHGSDGALSHSAEAVRSRIKDLIDEEAPASILSDDQLVTILKSGGVDIARRTVAKYRESLKIPSSLQRRREKTLRSA
jgi:RNA polymerase sigma-54 factor